MNCTYCSDLIVMHKEPWVNARDGSYHTECLKARQDDDRAAEIGIAGGQGRSPGEVLRAGELVVLMILCMFGVAGCYWWIRALDALTDYFGGH